MSLSKIRLELARDHDFPNGSITHGYEFVAPLDANHLIEAKQFRTLKASCRVRRFWGDSDDEVGHLVRKPGGSWAFHYDINGDADDDETGYRFGDHRFVEGEYVSIKEHDDHMRTFRVAAVSQVS